MKIVLPLIKQFFQRSKVADWELALLRNIFSQLPPEFNIFRQQVEAGLLKGILKTDRPLPNNVGFSYNTKVVKDFEDRKGRFFAVENLEVFDLTSQQRVQVRIHFSNGLIVSYSTPDTKNFMPDVSKIRTSNFRKRFFDEDAKRLMKELLDESEIRLINPSDFYEITLDGKEYFHIMELEDGDLIGIDRDKNVYEITQDPYEIKLLKGSIAENLLRAGVR